MPYRNSLKFNNIKISISIDMLSKLTDLQIYMNSCKEYRLFLIQLAYLC